MAEASNRVTMELVPAYSSAEFVYRKQLLHISDLMTCQDIQRLLWLLKSIVPLAEAEKISHICQLFEVLEEQRLLDCSHLGNLCKYITAIGRQDLVGSLGSAAEHSQSLESASVVGMPDSPRDYKYRELLLRISDRLSARDIRGLLWLLKKVIPKRTAEKLTQGYQLFDELEKRGLLSPRRLGFLRMHLLAANREDLASILDSLPEIVTKATVPHLPSTLNTARYTQVFRMKITDSASNIRSLALIGTAQVGEVWDGVYKMINSLAHEIGFAAELDIPVQWWEPTATAAQVDDIIRNTLQSAFAYAKAHISSLREMVPTDMEAWQSCCQRYQQFDNEMDRMYVRWNTRVRKKISEAVGNRMHPHGKLASHVCEYTRSICTDLLQDEQFKAEVDEVSKSLFVLESAWYEKWQVAGLFHWVSNLLHLGRSSVVDLSRYRRLLRSIFAQHKENIEMFLEEFSHFIGKDGMRQLSPVLELLNCRPCSSSTSKYVVVCAPTLWYMLLVELIAVAEGYNIDPREIGKVTLQNLISEGYTLISNVKVIQSATCRMHDEVLKLWKHASEVATTSHYSVPVYELFPNQQST